MTSASAERDLLILIVSFNRSLLSPAPDEASRSDPARSTTSLDQIPFFEESDVPRLSIASHLSSVSGFTPLTLRVKTECDRDDRSFIRVAATARRELARSSRVATDRGLLSGTDHQLSRHAETE